MSFFFLIHRIWCWLRHTISLVSTLNILFLSFLFSAYKQHLVWLLGCWLWHVWLQPVHRRSWHPGVQTSSCCWKAWVTGSLSFCVTGCVDALGANKSWPLEKKKKSLSNTFDLLPLFHSPGCPTGSGPGATGWTDAQNDGDSAGRFHSTGPDF